MLFLPVYEINLILMYVINLLLDVHKYEYIDLSSIFIVSLSIQMLYIF